MSRRIKVAPGRLAALLCLFLLCALPALAMNSLFGYFPLLFLLFLTLLSAAYGAWTARCVSCRLAAEQSAGLRGSRLSLKLALASRSRLFAIRLHPQLVLRDCFGAPCAREQLHVSLAPGRERTLSFSADLEHVGCYQLDVARVWVDDLLGVLSFAGQAGGGAELSSLPRIHTIPRLILSQRVRCESQRASQLSAAESLDYAGVREYAYGDPIKRIHWKLSSHAGSYVTKQLESYGSNGLTILLDPAHDSRDHASLMAANDLLLECAVSLGRYAADHGMESEWIGFTPEGEKRRHHGSGQDSIPRLLELLPRGAEPGGDQPLSRLLQGDTLGPYTNSNLVVCTAALDEAAASVLLQQQQSGKQVLVFLAHPVSMDRVSPSVQTGLELLRSHGVQCRLLERPEDLEGVVGL